MWSVDYERRDDYIQKVYITCGTFGPVGNCPLVAHSDMVGPDLGHILGRISLKGCLLEIDVEAR
jgi:hypothetical protein